MAEEGTYDSLEFALKGTQANLESWGHQYIRSLAGEVSDKFQKLLEENADPTHLNFLVDIIAPHLMKTHEEPEAVDLLLEVEQIDKIVNLSVESNYKRVCKYLLTCS
jgi:26S proteasome regulatory subunit N1